MQAIEALHPARELGLRRLHQQVEVVVEQHPDVELPTESSLNVQELPVPRLAIEVVEDDRPLLDAAADHVVPRGTRQLGPRDPRHSTEASATAAPAKPSGRA
ncbi:MAG TPA: hypothetical protein VM049_05410 [Gaiellaceae bacterium]|nr:hypothetical protein [Gaiellaceae bacterium]